VRFPDYQERWGWRAVGARTDEVHGRRALTVVYRKRGRGVHYTVVDGSPLELSGDRQRLEDGTPVAVLRDGGARMVAWHEGGHTCILTSRDLDERSLLVFAAW
jgi:hypothetical protein